MSNNGRSRNEPTSPDRVRTTLETQTQAAQMRAAGATFREIGQALGIDHTWARTLVLRALDAAQYEGADLMRTQEGARLDRMQRAIWQNALAGDLKAIQTVLRISERRARLFGLDAPVQVTLTDDWDTRIEALAKDLNVVVGEVIHDDT